MSKINFQSNLGILTNNAILLGAIISASLVFRFYFFPFGIPLVLDAFNYFWYASDLVLLGRVPDSYTFANNGWPLFVSLILSLMKANSMIMQMEMQRIITVIVSALTVVPVYFLCRRFVENRFALIGATLFAFEPRLIQDSLSGLNNSLYIALATCSLVLFLSSKKNARYYSFALIGVASLVRSEGMFLFFALSIIYLLNYRKDRKAMIRYGSLLLIFVIIIAPIAVIRIQTTGSDALTSRIVTSTSEIIVSNSSSQDKIFNYISNGVITFSKFLVWDMIPIFIFFIPVGIFLIFKTRNFEKNTIILVLFITSIPTFYAYSVSAMDAKYFYYLYPLFCVLSVLAIKRYVGFVSNSKILFFFILVGIIIGSIIFLDLKLVHNDHDKEAVILSRYIGDNAKGVNNYYPEVAFVFPAEVEKQWPILNSSFKAQLPVLPTEEFHSLKEFINFNKNKGLTHIVTDDNNKTPEFIRDVFFHPENYTYLDLVFDYRENGFTSYHVKVYKINYEKFNQLNNLNSNMNIN